MASLLSFAKKKLDAAYHGINPLDHGQGWTSVAPQRQSLNPTTTGPNIAQSIGSGGLRINSSPGPQAFKPPVPFDLNSAILGGGLNFNGSLAPKLNPGIQIQPLSPLNPGQIPQINKSLNLTDALASGGLQIGDKTPPPAQPKPSLLSQAGHLAKQVGEGIVQAPADIAKVDIVNPAKELLARATGNDQAYKNALQSDKQILQPKRLAGDIAQLGLIAGGGPLANSIGKSVGGLGGKVLGGATSTALFGGASELSANPNAGVTDVLKAGGLSALLGGGLPLAGAGAKAGVKGIQQLDARVPLAPNQLGAVSAGNNPLTPGKAKQKVRLANKSNPNINKQTGLDLGLPNKSNELDVLNQLRPKTKAIPLASTAEKTGDVATKTTKAGNTVPLGVKSGTTITKKIADLPINSRPLFGTPERVIKQITKDKAGRDLLTKTIIAPQDKAVTKTAQEVEKHLGTLRSTFEQSGILNGTKVNSELGDKYFKFVEKGGADSKAARRQLYQSAGNTTGKKLIETDKKLRPLMDDLLKRQNEARAAVGKEPIPFRKNYITHLQDQGLFGGLNMADTSTSPNPFSRSTGRLNPFSKQREGKNSLTDPVKATEAYVRASTAEIHSHEPVARLNTLIDALEQRKDVPTNVTNWLKQQRDIVGGQGHWLDNAVNSTQLGKAGLTVLNKATQQAGRNLIGANPASVLTQPAQLVQSGAKLGWGNTIKALGAPLKGKALTAESEFLTGRHAHLDSLAPGLTHRLVSASLKPIEATQKAIDRIIFDAAKHRASQLGLKGAEAAKWADSATKETVAARGLGQTPHAYNSKIGNSALQFSLEMGNSIHQLAADELRHGRVGGITSFMIGAYGFNQAFNLITGKSQGVILDPIQAALDVKKDAQNGQYIQAAGRLPGELLANAPGGQVLAGGVKALNNKLGNQLFGQAGAGRYGVGVPAIEAVKAGLNVAKKPLDALAFGAPAGGVPIKRGIEGLLSVAGGNVDNKKGESIYKPAQTPQNYVRGALFGRSTTGEGKNYVQKLQDNLSGGSTSPTTSKEQQAILNKNSPEAKAASDKIKTELKLNPDSVGLRDLPNGEYAYTKDGEVKFTHDLKTARKELAVQGLQNSEEQSKVIGNKYYYKDENGDVKAMPKYRHEFDVADSKNQLDMYVAKDNEDYATWNSVAQNQLKALETLRDKYNQDSQSDKVDDTQKKIETLKHDIAKYAGYGGAFTKGKSGKGKKSSFNTSGFKTASSGRAPKAPRGVKVGKVAAFKAPSTRKLSVSRMPKITG